MAKYSKAQKIRRDARLPQLKARVGGRCHACGGAADLRFYPSRGDGPRASIAQLAAVIPWEGLFQSLIDELLPLRSLLCAQCGYERFTRSHDEPRQG